MSEGKTQNLTDGGSFEGRAFARFDALDARMNRMEARLDDMDGRLQVLEAKAYDTKPAWERAPAEILAPGERMHTLERKLNVPGRDMLDSRADQPRLEDRMDRLESGRAQ